MSTIVVTDARPQEVADARRFAVDTGMFEQEESAEVERQLLDVIRGQEAGTVLVAKDGTVVVGAGYFAPEPFSDRCWNLYFLVVDRDHQGAGVGGQIVSEVERRLRDLGPAQARVLLIETSSTEKYVNARAFYSARGYVREATVRDYYGPEDHKVIFWKQLHE